MNVRKAVCLLLLLVGLSIPLTTTSSNSSSGSLVINEVFWGGTASEVEIEWIELVNTSGAVLSVDGWRLVSSDGYPSIALAGEIPALSAADPGAGYYLLERGTDDTVPDITADVLYNGALSDGGETLMLIDDTGAVVDTANLPSESASPDVWPAWPAGSNGWIDSSSHASMERTDYRVVDVPESWVTSTSAYAVDDRVLFYGTPRAENTSLSIPPTARISIHPAHPIPQQTVLLDALASTGVNDPLVSYVWTFGDGTTGNGQTANHTYDAAGEYLVTLTVEDQEGETAASEVMLQITDPLPPIADFSYRSVDGVAGTLRAGCSVLFVDESAVAHFGIAAYSWSFGDGQSAEIKNPSHVYESPGTYTVCLAIEDELGETAIQTASIVVASEPPIAEVTWTPAVPMVGEDVAFDASGSHDPDGEIISYSWDVDGDGVAEEVTSDPLLSVTFCESQTQSLSVFATDDNGDVSDIVLCRVYVDQPPIAQFALSSFSVAENETIECNDLSYDVDGSIVAWNWSFGEEAESTQSSPAYAFLSAGTHPICLEVTDEVGAVASTCAEVTVSNLTPVACLVVAEPEKETGSAFRLDASGSTDPSPLGSLVLYEWDLDGDGVFDRETTSAVLSYAYAEDGTYAVAVRVTDDAGETDISGAVELAVLNRIPTVSNVVWTPKTFSDGEAAAFSASYSDADGSVVSVCWFVDATGASDRQAPTLTFDDDGTYDVCLAVTDDDGAPSAPYCVTVDVLNAAPVASLSASLTGLETPYTIRFDASASYDPSPTGELVHVAWDFGDGTTCPGTTIACGGTDAWHPIHTFPESGTYSVTLIVMDEQGSIGEITRIVRIEP